MADQLQHQKGVEKNSYFEGEMGKNKSKQGQLYYKVFMF